MINRVLIRIKVIQMLYSYLLIENRFMLESQPSAPTKEKRFAYSLYLDMLMLFERLSGLVTDKYGRYPLKETRLMKKLFGDDRMISLRQKYATDVFPFSPIEQYLAEKISSSTIYKDYLKNDDDKRQDDDSIWERIYDNIILPDPRLNALMVERENFTIRGVDRMKEMMKTTFSNFYGSRGNLTDALKSLDMSLGKARELYIRLLLLPVDLVFLREQQIEENKHKHLPTREDLNPNPRFIENELVERIKMDPALKSYIENGKYSWLSEDRPMMERLLKTIMESELYKEYMEFPASDLQADATFWRECYKQIILTDEDFLESMEASSIFWNDDLEIMSTFLLKTFKRYESVQPGESCVLAAYKDTEDANFGKELFSEVIRNKDVYRKYIDDSLIRDKWDTDRLAVMDVIITMTALAEILNFPKIPLVVSINEYIEMAKSYSTSKSGAFVNGLLKTILTKLKEEGKLIKS